MSKEEDMESGWLLDLKGSDPINNVLYYGDVTLTNAPVYTEHKKNLFSNYIIYWFFYPFNGWRNSGATSYHEVDWEHIVVKLDENDNATDVAYYQHRCAPDTLAWSEVELAAGTHPVVYSALGGHASFADYREGDHDPPACAQSPLDTVAPGGKAWDTWKNTITAGRQSWYGFGGAWGDKIKSTVAFYGPLGPGPTWSTDPKIVPSDW